MKNQKLIVMKKLSFSVKEYFCSNPCSHKACLFMFNTAASKASHLTSRSKQGQKESNKVTGSSQFSRINIKNGNSKEVLFTCSLGYQGNKTQKLQA